LADRIAVSASANPVAAGMSNTTERVLVATGSRAVTETARSQHISGDPAAPRRFR